MIRRLRKIKHTSKPPKRIYSLAAFILKVNPALENSHSLVVVFQFVFLVLFSRRVCFLKNPHSHCPFMLCTKQAINDNLTIEIFRQYFVTWSDAHCENKMKTQKRNGSSIWIPPPSSRLWCFCSVLAEIKGKNHTLSSLFHLGINYITPVSLF